MTITIRKVDASIPNELALPAVTDSNLVDLLNIDNVIGLWQSLPATLQGRVTDMPWAWCDRKFGHKFKLTQDGYAPGLVDEDAVDGLPYLRFGYGASGTDDTKTLSASSARNGNLMSEHGRQFLFRQSGFTMFTLARVPVVGGVGGSTPGGSLVGNKIDHSATYSTSVNSRWSGLNIGYASVVGEGRICLNGDARFIDANGGTNDFRDGLWHLHVGTFDYTLGVAPQVMNLRIDGADRGSAAPSASVAYDISTQRGTTELRFGATGYPDKAVTSLEVPFIGDARLVCVVKGADTGLRSDIEDWILSKYSVG